MERSKGLGRHSILSNEGGAGVKLFGTQSRPTWEILIGMGVTNQKTSTERVGRG